MAADLELGDFEGLLLVDADAPLWQFQHLGVTHLDLQAVVEQFALDALFVFAALRQMIGAAADEEGAAQGGTGEVLGTTLGHFLDQRFTRAVI
ncbi:hypothetical protein D3C78_1539300 [compost metagenome]